MDIKFDKEPAGDAPNQGEQEGKGRQTMMLVVLVVLLCGFGYVYFFTGLIRPQEQPPAPQPPPQMVKKPLPSRDGATPAKPDEKAPSQPGKADAPAKAAVKAVPPTVSPAKPADQKAATVKPSDQKVPAPPLAKAEPPKPSQQQKVAQAPKAEPQKQAKQEPPKPLKPEPAKNIKPIASAKADQKPATAKAEPAKTAVLPKPDDKAAAPKPLTVKKNGPWTLVVGSYIVEEVLAGDISRVKGQGLSPVITSGGRRSTVMYRLVYNTYPDTASAQQAVEMLKKKGASAFSVKKGTTHTVIAGSYSMQDRAVQEQKRLAATGAEVKLQKTTISIPSRKLTAGTFTDRGAAEAAIKKLKKASIGNPVLE